MRGSVSGRVENSASPLRATIVTTIGLACALAAPFLISMASNELRAKNVLSRLTSAKIPSAARYVSTSSRVFNSGNSDGCDYEANAIIIFDGPLDELAKGFKEALKFQYGGNELSYVKADDPDHWSAKLSPSTTELYIDRQTTAKSRFVASLREYPRSEGFDIRCW